MTRAQLQTATALATARVTAIPTPTYAPYINMGIDRAALALADFYGCLSVRFDRAAFLAACKVQS
jgi:hypothetical protein